MIFTLDRSPEGVERKKLFPVTEQTNWGGKT